MNDINKIWDIIEDISAQVHWQVEDINKLDKERALDRNKTIDNMLDKLCREITKIEEKFYEN